MRKQLLVGVILAFSSCTVLAASESVSVTLQNETREGVKLEKINKDGVAHYRISYLINDRILRTKVLPKKVYVDLISDFDAAIKFPKASSSTGAGPMCMGTVKIDYLKSDNTSSSKSVCTDNWNEESSQRFARWYKTAARWSF